MKKSTKILLISIIIILVAFGTYFVIPKHNVFVRVGDMNIPRVGHKAVLLKDGRVLILGGDSKNTVEIYNPKNKKFKLVEEMLSGDVDTATLLNDGKVLITGINANAELFDPRTEKFKLTNDMNYSRSGATATLLKNGRTLIIGGKTFTSQNGKPDLSKLVPVSEIYNPKTEKFEIVPKLNTPRSEHFSILLKDGNVLILGGNSINNIALNIPELYIVKMNKFIKLKETSCSIITFGNPLPVVLKNGYILIPYCKIFKKRVNMKILNPNSLLIEDTSVSLNHKFIGNKSILLKDGNVLFFGGAKEQPWYYSGIKNSFVYNPHLNKLIDGPSLNFARASSTATLLNNGNVLITGGKGDTADNILKSAELYLP